MDSRKVGINLEMMVRFALGLTQNVASFILQVQ